LSVIAVLVGQKDSINTIDRFTDGFEHQTDALSRKPSINEYFTVSGPEQGAIPITTGT
jgi:hypothetical protein